MKFLSAAGFLSLAYFVLAIPANGQDCCHHGHDSGGCRSAGHPCCHGAQSMRMGPAASAASAALQSLQGKIVEIVYLPGATPESALVELRLQTSTGIQLVRLSPAGFLKNGGLIVREGDTVAVKGFEVAGMEGDLVVASEIQKGEKTLQLRDARGLSAW